MTNTTSHAGVMGWPIEHSLSPRLHGYWLKKYGIAGDYRALAVKPENLGVELKSLAAQDFRGVNLTVPHKELAMPMVDELDALAKRVGATNTVVVQKDGKLLGRNTDVYGFTQNLVSAGFERTTKTATLLGAGGAARAGLVALIDMGFTDIRIANRTRENAEKLAEQFGADKINVFDWDDPDAFDGSELLTNATSLGLKGQPPLKPNIGFHFLPKTAWVTDMVYAPLETDLLMWAKERGNKTVDGLGMLLYQAKPAFHAFFGVDPDVTPELRTHVLEGR